jgi:prevent-host-death family protein
MRFVGVREAQQGLSGLVKDCQAEGVVLTRHGKPVALLTGVEGYDPEEVLLAHDPAFWRLIEERRRPGAKLVPHEALLSRAREELTTYRAGARSAPARRRRR